MFKIEQYTIDCVKHELKDFKQLDKFRIRLNDGVILLQQDGVDFAKISDYPPLMMWIEGTMPALMSFNDYYFNILYDMKFKINSGVFDKLDS